MLQTIVTGSHISVQGEFVRKIGPDQVMIRVGEALFVGRPVQSSAPQMMAGQHSMEATV